MYKSKRTLLPLLAIILLVLQMMNPVPVYADGETPPDPPATEETPPPEEQTDPTEEAPAEETPSAEEGEVIETPFPEDAAPIQAGEGTEEPLFEATPSPEGDDVPETPPAEKTGSTEEPTETKEVPASKPTEGSAPDTEADSSEQEDLTVAEVLEQAPDGTEVVVINEEGQVEPLVTEEAAEIVEAADPIWCPAGQAPTPGANGCTSSYTSLQDLLNYLNTNEPGQAGTIWIEDSYDSSTNDPSVSGFTIDGTILTTMSNYDLTVQGGWSGISGSTAITGTSTFTGDSLYITNWSGDVTLNDIVVDGAAADGIFVSTRGDINLENVTSSNNEYSGAWLYNAYSGSTRNITLTSTNVFNGNIGYGLEAASNGNITLNNVTAYNNGDSGIYAEIYNAGTLTVQNSTLGSSLATGNGNDGLEVYTDGSVIINNVNAIGNDDNGVKVYADYGDGDLTVSNSTLSQNGDEGFEGYTYIGEINFTKVFANQNAQIGLLLETYEGDITLDNITANMNGQDGADLFSLVGNINVFTGQFNSNNEFGLWLDAWDDGDVALNNIIANTNALGGAVLQTSSGNINVSNSQFNSNGATATPNCKDGLCEYYPPIGGIGLAAASWLGTGQIKLENVQASNNYGDGAWLEGDDIFVRNSTFHSNGQGLPYLGGDDLWADGLFIEDMGGSSAYLECVRAKNNTAYGIEIITGDITLNGITVSGNGWDNTYLESDTLNILENPCKKLKTTPDIPWQIVPVSGGESVELNCSVYAGTILVLPNGDEIRLPCPTIGEGNLVSVTSDDLPNNLPDGNNYVSSFTALVIQGGISLEVLPAPMIVSFLIPDDMLDADLAILYWDGTEWAEVAGAYKIADDRFEASVDYTGIFVLVSK